MEESTERNVSLGENYIQLEKVDMKATDEIADEVDSIKQSVVIPESAYIEVQIEAKAEEKKKKKKGLFKGRSRSKSKSKRKQQGRLKLQIGAPTDMRRTAGLSMNPNTGRMELACEDEKMAEILVNMGIVGSDNEAIQMLKDKRKRSRIDSAIEESGGIEKVLLATKQLTPTPEENESKGRLQISAPIVGTVTKNGKAFKYEAPVDIPQKKKSKEPGLIKKVLMRKKSKPQAPPPPKCDIPVPPPPPPSGPTAPAPATSASTVTKANTNDAHEDKPAHLREFEDSHQNLLQMIHGGPNLRHVSISERAPPPLSPRSEVMKNLLKNPKSNLKHVATPPPKKALVFEDYFLSALEKQLQEIKRMTHSDSENDSDQEESWDEEIFF